MREVHELFFIVQGNCVEVSTEMILLLTLVKVHYKEGNEFDIINNSCEKDWLATTPFRDISYVKMTTCRRKAARKNITLIHNLFSTIFEVLRNTLAMVSSTLIVYLP